MLCCDVCFLFGRRNEATRGPETGDRTYTIPRDRCAVATVRTAQTPPPRKCTVLRGARGCKYTYCTPRGTNAHLAAETEGPNPPARRTRAAGPEGESALFEPSQKTNKKGHGHQSTMVDGDDGD